MIHDSRSIRVGHLVGAATFALLLVACSDSREVTAPGSNVPTITATMTTSVESFDAQGGRNFAHAFTGKVKGVPNAAGFTMVPPTDPIYCGGPCASVADIAPVLFVPSGSFADNYDESAYDDQGNLIRFVATGPGYQPITDVWVWVNGQPQVHLHNVWTAVSGGFKLYNQTIKVVRPDYVKAVLLSTTVSAGYTMVSSTSLGARFAGVAGNALSRIGCWLAPQVAYANIPSQCGSQALVFAGETFVLGAGTVALFGTAVTAPPVTPLAASAYLAGWGLWTRSLYDILSCIDNARSHPHRTVTLPNYYGF